MKNVAFFDFCDTLVSLQSADRFIEFVNESKPTKLSKWVDRIRTPLKKRGIMPNFIGKRLVAMKMRGHTVDEVDPLITRYVDEILWPAQHKETINALKLHVEKGDTVVIASAGYTPYIKEFARRLGVEIVVATDLAIKNGRYTGHLDGPNCQGKIKIQKLSRVLDLNEIDKTNSHAYSDELRDMPLFDLADHKHFVARAGTTTPTLPPGFTVIETA